MKQEIEAIEFILKDNEFLEQQCKKQQEVINKAIEYCDNNKEFAPRLEDALDILKEVSE